MSNPKVLPIKTIDQVIDTAIKYVDEERQNIQRGLLCRFSKVNQLKGKYWRYGKVTLLAGLSGHGKSAFLNMLEDDFTNVELNKNFKEKHIVLAFKYEMEAKDEVLRNISGKMEKSYNYLLSSEYLKDGETYNTISDDEFEFIKSNAEKLRGRPILYVESSGNLEQLLATVIHIRTQHPDAKITVTIDHILLSKKLGEKDDLELMSNTAHYAIILKKMGINVIFLSQLNGEIERSTRKENPTLHYPSKIDIHCGNQIYWACDDVMVFHRPELLGIEKYGKYKIPTKSKIHLAYIKSRGGNTGNIFFLENFYKGGIIQLSATEAQKDYGETKMKF